MKRIRYLPAVLLAFSFLTGCEEDVYMPVAQSSYAVVYFIVDKNDTAHYVRLTKTFSGPVDAYVMAQNPDSLYYKNARVFAEVTGKTVELELTEEVERDPGIFFSDYSLLYKTTYPLCGEVRIHIYLPDDGLEVLGSTSIMDDPVFEAPDPAKKKELSFYEDKNVTILWNGTKSTCQTTLRIKYLEITDSGMDSCHLDWIRKSADFAILPQDLLDYLNNWIRDRSDVRYRKMLGMDILVATGNSQMADYMKFKDWSIDYIDTPYSNLVNAYGLVAARTRGELLDYKFNQKFIDTLVNNSKTEHLKFVRW
jgi:hypothetical protein